MVEIIRPNLFRIEVPLPHNPLKALNCYVFKGEERNLIIDTGFDREECWAALQAGLRELEIDLSKTDLFITHLHGDHSGMIHRLVTPTSKVYASELDAKAINAYSQESAYWDELGEFARKSGFPPTEVANATKNHPGNKYGPKGPITFTYVRPGDTIEVADYCFTCLATPGHTQGHMCLYDQEKEILFSGDHILGHITPNISLFSDKYNPLQQYLESLERIAQLPVELTLPGHRYILGDCRPRIAELLNHHQERIAEVLAIVGKGTFNAFEVAAQMTWDMSYATFAEFPITQKWFACGEAAAHLKYLESQGSIQRLLQGDMIYYSK